MTHEQRVDDRMFAWLEAGPSEAPDRPLDAAVAYARAHPRRRLTPAGLGRMFSARLSLTALLPRTGGRLSLATVAVAAVAVVAVVAGGALLVSGIPGPGDVGGGPGAGPIATPRPSLGPTPVPTPSPTPPPVEVTGSQSCEAEAGGTESTAGAVTQVRGMVLACTQAMSDSRLDGAVEIRVSIDQQPDDSAEIWGTATIENPDGRWSGAWRGTVDAGYTTHRMTGVFIGGGAYAGLRFRFSMVTSGDAYAVSGTIEDVASIPAAGVPAIHASVCSVANSGTTTTVEGIEQTRGMVLLCGATVSDPRLEGDITVTVDIETRADGSADMRGTSAVRNEGGAWTGSFSGTVAAGYTTHRLTGTLVGSEGYAGLAYPFTQVGTGETVYVMTGVITTSE